MDTKYDLIIVGGGIGGSAAALRAVQYHIKVCWIYGDKKTSKSSRSKWIHNIDNMIGFNEGIVKDKLLKIFSASEDAELRKRIEETHLHIGGVDILRNTLKRIEDGYSEFIDIINESAQSAEKSGDNFIVKTIADEYSAPALLLATGVMDRQPHIRKDKDGNIIDSTKWLYPFANRETILYCIRCEGHLTPGTKVAVLGSGEASAQIAFMLIERYKVPVVILTNGEALEVAADSQTLLDKYGIEVFNSRIADMIGERGMLGHIDLEDGTRLDVQFGLVAAGLYRVYNDLAVDLGATLADDGEPTEIRHVQVDKKSETSVSNLFAVGDMAKRSDEIVMKQIYTAQEYAVRAVDSIDYRRRMKSRKALLAQS